MPRTMAIAASLSRWIPRRRASNTTIPAARAATSACARPSWSGVWKNILSMQHLADRAGAHHTAACKRQRAVRQARRLVHVVGDHHAAEPLLAHDGADQ